MRTLEIENRKFLIKAEILENSIDDVQNIKKKYSATTVLKRNVNNQSFLYFVDEIKDVDFNEISK